MKTPQERKSVSEAYIRARGIGVFEGLPVLPSANEVRCKGLDAVCRRAVASLLMTQIAMEISREQYGNVSFFVDKLKAYGVMGALNAKEQRLVSGMFSAQDVLDVVWEYECCWALDWTLGLVEDISDAGSICDCERAIGLVASCRGSEEFRSRCTMRSTEEILDMLDLYYRYHWACVQHRHIDPQLPVGDLNEEVVFERRRGLEWLISEEQDWHEIAMNT
ncbi:MAG: DUF4272 domain-containing protein [Oscillospiraceae bacterium]|nr:DUF4272 domain-containing protein [Oscillospiraceae bacterium]